MRIWFSRWLPGLPLAGRKATSPALLATCGGCIDPPRSIAVLGQIVDDRYRIEEELGAGAMGRVYRARHLRVGNQVAIKVLHAELLASPRSVARFAREAQIAARLNHPNVAGVLDVGALPDGRQIMVLELARGRRLTAMLGAPMARGEIIDITRQLLGGLAHAHRAGLIHRDLKPDNILVEDRPNERLVRIVDFGIAVLRDRENEARLTELNTIVGTPHYMSPEHATGREVDARTDLFALGVIVYEMLAGAQPFAGTGAEVAHANVHEDPPRISVQVDPLLEAFARKLMARRLDRRFQSADEALAMLEVIARDRIAAARVLSAPLVMRMPARFPAGTTPPSLPANSDVLPTQKLPTTQIRRKVEPLRVGFVVALFVALFLLGYWIV